MSPALIFSSQSHHNPSHFWLNEGWTTYIERVLQQKLHGPEERGFSYVIGSKALYDSLKGYVDRPKYQRLVIHFDEGEDPDDAYSSIPYEKGANFILHLGSLHPIIAHYIFITFTFATYRTNSGRTRCLPAIRKGLRRNFHRKEHHDLSMERTSLQLLGEEWRTRKDQSTRQHPVGCLALRRGHRAPSEDGIRPYSCRESLQAS